ncbi:MAG: hypothetical protein AAF236_08640 [Verrucomicrobiota bacterium]
MNARLALATVLSLFATFTLSSCVSTGSGGGGSTSINDTARYLGGLSGSTRSELAVPRTSSTWQTHSRNMDGLWANHSGMRGKLRGFRGEISGLTSPSVLFYPFGGPDYLHAAALFPGARNYVLVGLEAADAVPELSSLSQSELSRGLGGVSNSLRTVTGASYFITKEMRVDLQSTRFKGTLPLILAQVARNGQSVSSVSMIGLDSAGRVTSRAAGAACPGFLIRAGGKNIYYFREDLSNGGLGDGRLLKFVSSKGSPVTFVKSASYLMHGGGFSRIRSWITSNSRGLVQGASGVPYRYLKDSGMSIKLYGNYQRPLGVFSSYMQSDLAAAYRNGTHPVKPLSFGLGYLRNPSSACIIVARR